MIIAKFANSVDPDGAAHHKPHHLDLHCLPGVGGTQYQKWWGMQLGARDPTPFPDML